MKSQSRCSPAGLGNHCNCDSFVKRISKENMGTNCSPLLTLNTPANYQLSAVHKAPWCAADVAVSRIDSFTLYAHKLRKKRKKRKKRCSRFCDHGNRLPDRRPDLFAIRIDKNSTKLKSCRVLMIFRWHENTCSIKWFFLLYTGINVGIFFI